jgi:hypothetical protein
MTFEQERAYLDKLLSGKDKSAPNIGIDTSVAER